MSSRTPEDAMRDAAVWASLRTREEVITLACEVLGVEQTYRSSYRCEECQREWEDDWSCACDSECPDCGRDFSPFESWEIDDAGNEVKDEDNG